MKISKEKKRQILKKEIFLFGIGKRAEKFIEDFRYIFAPEKVGGCRAGNSIYELADIKWSPLIIMCELVDHDRISDECRKAGYVYGEDFFFADDFFELLNDESLDEIVYFFEDRSIRNALVVLYHGYLAKNGILEKTNQLINNTDIQIKSVDVSDKVKTYFYGMIEGITSFIKGRIFVDYESMEKQEVTGKKMFFLNVGDYLSFRKKHEDFNGEAVVYQDIEYSGTLSELFKATYYDDKQTDCACTMPFERLMVNFGGLSITCNCPGGNLLIQAGNTVTRRLEELWNSTLMKIIRVSFLNRTYSFCNRAKTGCEYLRTKDNHCEGLKRLKTDADVYPRKNLLLAIEEICNLKCPSCRKEHRTKNAEEMDLAVSIITDKLIESRWLEKTGEVNIGGNGEVFLAKGYKRLMYEAEGKCISVATNGTLLTPETFEPLRGKYKEIKVDVSVDAITEETYKKLRGGDFKKLMENMKYLSELRQNGDVSYVNVNLIVQRDNFREMKDFVLWAKKMHFDSVFLSEIDNWSTYSDEEFEKISMFDKDHHMKPELAEIAMDPIFSDPIVRKKWEGSL